jgi:hypothetical protein
MVSHRIHPVKRQDMPKYDEQSLERYFARMTPEQRQKAQEVLANAGKRDQSMQELVLNPLVEEVHAAIAKAAEETNTSADDIRLAELRLSGTDPRAYENRVTKLTEEWKKKNATHRNPNNPEEIWCSQDGKGNPPKWVRDANGPKPDPKTNPEGHKKWLENLDKFAIKPNGEDKME